MGAYVESGRWTVKLLRDLLCDPIMHGTRTFRDVVHQPIFRTGKYRRDKSTPETEYVAELAFMTREEQEAMLAPSVGPLIGAAPNRLRNEWRSVKRKA